jgi:hypothetical protein
VRRIWVADNAEERLSAPLAQPGHFFPPRVNKSAAHQPADARAVVTSVADASTQPRRSSGRSERPSLFRTRPNRARPLCDVRTSRVPGPARCRVRTLVLGVPSAPPLGAVRAQRRKLATDSPPPNPTYSAL